MPCSSCSDIIHRHGSDTTNVVCSDGELYSATFADISSRDALIYKKPIRSEQHDSQWLNGNATSFFLQQDRLIYISQLCNL